MAGTDFAIIIRLLTDPRPFLVAMRMAMSKTAGMGRDAAAKVERSFRRRLARGVRAGAQRAFRAAGGAAAELLAALLEREPRKLRHRGRAVTLEDYEDLAKLASPDVARAKCVPLYDLETNPGAEEHP